jgi:prephenate dehydrogenase
MFNYLSVIGVGLIGGSIARKAREQGLAKNIVGVGYQAQALNLRRAEALGVVDQISYFGETAEAVLAQSDCVIIAVPVGSVDKIFLELKKTWNPNAVYSDVGSTKGSVVQSARDVFGVVPDNFVPVHPIAGAENSGVNAAQLDLFTGKRVIITPTENTSDEALCQIRFFWKKLGANVSTMGISHHDAVLAATSHLPHVLAFALVRLLDKKDSHDEIFKYAAGGFKDFTRIASSDPSMWLDICMNNKDEIIPLIRQINDELEEVAQFLIEGDSESVYKTFATAKSARQRFLDQCDE